MRPFWHLKQSNKRNGVRPSLEETLGIAKKIASLGKLGADKIRDLIKAFFQLNPDFSLSINSSKVVLRQRQHPDRTVTSDSLAPECGARKGLLVTTLTLRTDQGRIKIRVTNPEDAKNVVIQGLKEFNRTNGALNRVITIE